MQDWGFVISVSLTVDFLLEAEESGVRLWSLAFSSPPSSALAAGGQPAEELEKATGSAEMHFSYWSCTEGIQRQA